VYKNPQSFCEQIVNVITTLLTNHFFHAIMCLTKQNDWRDERVNKCFAAIQPHIVEQFLGCIDDLRAGKLNLHEPHYDDKALTLFLLLRFHASCSLECYVNEAMLCELMGLAARPENKESIMSNILKMEEDGLLHMRKKQNNKFFYIVLDYNSFMAEKGFVRIYKEEFDQLIHEKNKDKLLLLLYSIKRFQHGKTEISFPSIETLISTSHMSKPTVNKCLKQISPLFHIYKARINFYDGTYKDINYYKSCSEQNGIDPNTVETIVKQHYSNVKLITERTPQND